ncbi:TRAP transporter permease, partial [Chloroflexota bacterium]
MAVLCVTIAVYHFYTAWFSNLLPLVQLWISLHLVMIVALLSRPLGRGWWRILDFVGIAGLLVFTVRFFVDYEFIILFGHAKADAFSMVAGTMTIIILIDLARRYLGWTIVILTIFIMLQGLVADKFPKGFFLYGPPITWRSIVEFEYLAEWGIWNIPVQVFSGFIVLFFVLVGVWRCAGVMDVVRDLALTIAGRYTGGPAKVAVIASAFFGTIQGASISNVVSSGSWTIPTMKATGYRPAFAGAVEAVASSGGLITPPVLGLAGFVMADFLNIPYLTIMAISIIPALLFYAGTLSAVHFEAKRAGLPGLPPSQIPRLLPVLARSWLFVLPIAVLILLLLQGFPIGTCVAWSVVALLIATIPVAGSIRWLTRRWHWLRPINHIFPETTPPKPQALLLALEDAGRMSINVGIAVATAG